MILRSLFAASLVALPSFAWNIVPEKDWFDTLQKHDYTLAACK